MLNKLAVKITSKLLLQKIIPENLADIYIYGFELLLSFLFSTSVILVIGILCDRFFQTIAFLLVFVALRSFTGGYHAKKYWVCTVVTLTTFCLTLLLSEFLKVSLLLYVILGIIGLVLITKFVPIENPNKPLSEKQRGKYKIISLVLFISFIAVGIAIDYVWGSISGVIFFTLMADLILLFIRNRKERRIDT